MSICLLRIGDGRDEYHEASWASAKEYVFPFVDEVVTVDDREHALGFAGAIQHGWNQVLETDCEYVFHLELDFVFRERVPVDRMADLLGCDTEIAQVALKRQPWNAEERAAGGIVELHPDDFMQCVMGGMTWTEHRRFFTTNPSLYRASLCRLGWPQEPESEGVFTHRLLADPLLRFAFWGGKFAAPMVEHIGQERAGVGY